ncbi:hypothetical protein PAPYR_12708 [Paratrimastix pyriformis]|uniref:Uncharacterized protein n=1 Tax=Paratrimastix pyriformis TaxID=342808 RepID=A0ABQ8U5V0_9EUKA|nr:hypothetical protein PAPYR_12708 [Paratrimastix pyriformis]
MLLIINPYFKLDYHFNCAPWIDGFPHSDTVYLHIQLLLYSSSETCQPHSSWQMICIEIQLVCRPGGAFTGRPLVLTRALGLVYPASCHRHIPAGNRMALVGHHYGQWTHLIVFLRLDDPIRLQLTAFNRTHGFLLQTPSVQVRPTGTYSPYKCAPTGEKIIAKLNS